MSARAAWLGEGRLHLQHGPIDLVIAIEADERERAKAVAATSAAFPDILPRLVQELHLLRQPIGDALPACAGPVARRMAEACWPWRASFITPMAAVAGAVADHVLMVMRGQADCRKIVVNNGGDIAFHLAPGQRLDAAIVADAHRPGIDAYLAIDAARNVRGIATSGWRGRSQSLGIADAVTVLARNGATADAAATMIANAVDVSHPAIRRLPACEVKDDSDLGDRLVTVAVGPLPQAAIRSALRSGAETAKRAVEGGLIEAAYLRLQGREKIIATPQGRPIATAA